MLIKIDLDDIFIDFTKMETNNVHCLYFRQHNLVIDDIPVLLEDCIIAYSDHHEEVVELRNSLIKSDKCKPTELYINSIPNIFQ